MMGLVRLGRPHIESAGEGGMGKFRIIIFIVVAILLAAFAIYQVREGGVSVYPQGALQYVRYSNGGGMTGGFSSKTLNIHEDGTGTLTTEYASWHGARTRTCVYEVSADLVARMRELVDSCELYKASDRPRSPFEVLDADTWSVTLDYGDQDYSFNEMQQLSRKENEGVSEMLNLFCEMEAVEPISDTLAPREVVMTVDGYTYTFQVNDSQAATDLCESLPLDLEGHADGSEIYVALPEGLDVGDCPEADAGSTGDLLYDPDTGELVIEGEAYEGKDGLYKLGEMESPYLDRLFESGDFGCYFYTYANEDY